jgi:hypothetical protein
MNRDLAASSLDVNPEERRILTTMAQQHYKTPFKKALDDGPEVANFS